MSPAGLLEGHRGVPRVRGMAPAWSARRPAGAGVLSRRDLMALVWLAEQYGARMDQLELLLDCGPRTVQRVVARLRDASLIRVERILVGEPAWVIPTRAGLAASGAHFNLWRPRLGLVDHVAAVNDVRLHIQARSPGAEWVPERVLARDREQHEHLPDGLVIHEGRRVAIEVELTSKSQKRLHAILDEHNTRFDAVLYFCAPAPYRQLTALAEGGAWPGLGVRELPRRTGT